MASDRSASLLTDAVYAQLADGAPVRAMLDGWRLMDAALRNPESLGRVLQAAAELDLSKAFASIAPASAFGFAVVGAGRKAVLVDGAFARWFGEPADSPGLRRLIQIAQRRGQASGLVDAADGQAIAACAGLAGDARGWPLPEPVRTALDSQSGRTVLMGFAPSRSPDLPLRAAEALGLTPMEARLAEALLDSPTLRVAAARIGIGYETAREALGKIRKRTGASNAADVVRRLMAMMVGDLPVERDLAPMMREALGATPAEARVGSLVAEGYSAPEIAARLGVKETTVRGQLKSLYAKAGVSRGRDLLRITAEASALAAVTQASETVTTLPSPLGRLRVLPGPGDRRIAFWDHGPRGGRPILVLHGAVTGRTLAPELALDLQRRGWRPIVPQRPGFGLTDPAGGDYLAQACADMALILDALRISRVRMAARDEGVAAALAFAERHPDRIAEGLLIKPRLDGLAVRRPDTAAGAIKRAMLARPEVIASAAEMLRRQTRTDLMTDILKRVVGDIAADRAVLASAPVAAAIVRDVQAMAARTSQGFADEQRLYAEGWSPPRQVGGRRWLVVECGEIALPQTQAAYAHLPDVSFDCLPHAGYLAFWSHAPQIAALIDSMVPAGEQAAA